MYEMTITHKKTNNCLDDVLENILAFHGINSVLMHLDSWNFVYLEKPGAKYFGNRINSNNTHWDVLSRYFPVEIQTYNSPNIKDKISYFEEEIKLGPIILYLDAYNVPWSAISNLSHQRHYIIACDSVKEGVVNCYDPFITGNELHSISRDIVFDKGTMFISIRKSNTPKRNSCYELMNYMISRKRNSDKIFYDSIRDYAKDIKNMDVELEIGNFRNLHIVPLFMQLHSITSGRYNVAQIFKYMFSISGYEEFNTFSEKMKSIHDLWRYTYKKIVLSKNNKNYVSDTAVMLNKLSGMEEELFNSIKTWINENKSKLTMEA